MSLPLIPIPSKRSNTIRVGNLTEEQKISLLYSMWCKQKIAQYFRSTGTMPPGFCREQARAAIQTGKIDYLCGRLIKIPNTKRAVWNVKRFIMSFDKGQRPSVADIIASVW